MSPGIRWACFAASSTVGRLGVGALRFLELGDANPSCASLFPASSRSTSFFASSFRRPRYKSCRAEGARRALSKVASLRIRGMLCSWLEILLNGIDVTPSAWRAWKRRSDSSGVYEERLVITGNHGQADTVVSQDVVKAETETSATVRMSCHINLCAVETGCSCDHHHGRAFDGSAVEMERFDVF